MLEYSSEDDHADKPAAGSTHGGPQYWSGYTPKQRKDLVAVDHKKMSYSRMPLRLSYLSDA